MLFSKKKRTKVPQLTQRQEEDLTECLIEYVKSWNNDSGLRFMRGKKRKT